MGNKDCPFNKTTFYFVSLAQIEKVDGEFFILKKPLN